MAHADGEGADIADAVDEAEGEDEPAAVALDERQRLVRAGTPARKARDQPRAVTTPEIEIDLVAAEAAEPGAAEQQRKGDQPLVREIAREHDEALALEGGPAEGQHIEERVPVVIQLNDEIVCGAHAIHFLLGPCA